MQFLYNIVIYYHCSEKILVKNKHKNKMNNDLRDEYYFYFQSIFFFQLISNQMFAV